MSSSTINDRNTLCQQYLDIVYHDAGKRATSNFRKANNIAQTNGEILYPAVHKLLSGLSLTESDVFVDLGSGTGKVVTQVFLTSVVKEAHGIELVPELHQRALQAAEKMQLDLPEFFQDERKLTFSEGSFLEVPLHNASVVLINSVCFNQKLLFAIGDLMNASPGIHTVLSLRPIANLQRLSFKKTIRVECSWDTALCYVYR